MAEVEDIAPEVYVQPGEAHLAKEPTLFRTVLGSCVGVAFWVPRRGIGALCHPMLPRFPAKQAAPMDVVHARRYVDFTIRDMARRIDELGIMRSGVRIKLFGGGDVLLVTDESSRPTVGKLNCEMALRVLEEEGLEVVASSLGGTSGLHIQFHTGTGEVLLRRLG
jgi:chemotaxis protein CheD